MVLLPASPRRFVVLVAAWCLQHGYTEMCRWLLFPPVKVALALAVPSVGMLLLVPGHFSSCCSIGCLLPSFTPLAWCVPPGKGPARQWGGESVFNKASEVGVNRTGMVPRSPGTLSVPIP